MANDTWLELKDVLNLDPVTKIWCVSIDGRIDCMMTAGDIAEAKDKVDWKGVNFGLITEQKKKKEEQPEKLKNTSITYTGKKYLHKIKILSSGVKEDIEERANEFMKDKNIVNVEYQTESRVQDTSLMVTYTVMIHYVEEG